MNQTKHPHREWCNNGIVSALILSFLWMMSSQSLHAINAAPRMSDFPIHMLSLPNGALIDKASRYRDTEHPDSALLCYMIVAERDFDTSSDESIRQGLKARYSAGTLYCSPFYDYGKAYSLFQDTYDLAKKHGNNEFMGLAANSIANVLTVYDGVRHSDEGTRDIIRWYELSVDNLVKAGKASSAVYAINNMLAMAMDTTLMKIMTPTFVKFINTPHNDTIQGYGFTRKRIDAYLRQSEGKHEEAKLLLLEMNADKNGIGGTTEAKIWSGFDLAWLYWQQGRTDSALYYVKKAKTLAEAEEMYDVSAGADLMESEIYLQAGDEGRYKDALLRYYRKQDSLVNLSTISLFSEPHLKKTIADIDVQLINAKNETHIRNLVICFVSALLAIAAAFAFIILRKNKTLNQKNRSLIEKLSIIDKQDQIILHDTINRMKRKRVDDKSDNEEERRGNPELLSKIIDVMENSTEIFNPEFSIDILARLCDEKTKVVSAELNSSLSKNFTSILNEYRVKEMCRRLNAPGSSSLTIEAIAREVGYRSRSTYIGAFKKHTGLTPSEYMKAMSRNHENAENPQKTE